MLFVFTLWSAIFNWKYHSAKEHLHSLVILHWIYFLIFFCLSSSSHVSYLCYNLSFLSLVLFALKLAVYNLFSHWLIFAKILIFTLLFCTKTFYSIIIIFFNVKLVTNIFIGFFTDLFALKLTNYFYFTFFINIHS